MDALTETSAIGERLKTEFGVEAAGISNDMLAVLHRLRAMDARTAIEPERS